MKKYLLLIEDEKLWEKFADWCKKNNIRNLNDGIIQAIKGIVK